MEGNYHIHLGDCLSVMQSMPDNSVHCCVTSPPYYGLRDYGVEGQLGLEESPDAYVAKMVDVFREVRRILRDDGTCWLNLGDSYAGYHGNKNTAYDAAPSNKNGYFENQRKTLVNHNGIKNKDLIGIPWRVALALQADGWYLRQDIIWHKPNPMPESVTDRCTKAHEYIFLLTKSARYWYDAEAASEPIASTSVSRLLQSNIQEQIGSSRVSGKTNGNMKAVVNEKARKVLRSGIESRHRSAIPGGQSLCASPCATRNRRSVWTVTTQPFKGAHFAVFPPKLIEPCVLAGCPSGGTVLDPFNGSGTTGIVSLEHGRKYIGIELNPEYHRLTLDRLEKPRRAVVFCGEKQMRAVQGRLF